MTDFTKPAPNFLAERLTAAAQSLATKAAMSIVGKLARIQELHSEYEKKLTEKADFMLERFAALDSKTDRVFHRHHASLDERDKSLDDIDAALDRLSNGGNSEGSSGLPGA